MEPGEAFLQFAGGGVPAEEINPKQRYGGG